MRKVIEKNLEKIPELEQKKTLYHILENCFDKVVDYNIGLYKKLEEEIKRDSVSNSVALPIYTSLVSKSQYDGFDEMFFPMTEQMTSQNDLTLTELRESPNTVLKTIYIDADYKSIRDIINSDLKVQLCTDNSNISVAVKLKQNMSYIMELKEFHDIVSRNGRRWVTVNCPYAFKMYDVVLCDPTSLEVDETVNEIVLDFGQYRSQCLEDMLILWNVQSEKYNIMPYFIPVMNSIKYQYDFYPQETEGVFYIPKLMKDFCGYVNNKVDQISIICDTDSIVEWGMYKIFLQSEEKPFPSKYRYISNLQDSTFYTRFRNQGYACMVTKGEIIRLKNAFECCKEIEIKDVYILQDEKDQGLFYDMNCFLEESLDLRFKPKLVIVVKVQDNSKDENDKISFFLSEMQNCYKEYNVIGIPYQGGTA